MRIPARPEHGFAWVTGASSGIGAQLVTELVRRGWRVAATARSPEPLEALAAAHPGLVLASPADVADASAMRAAQARAVAQFGPVGLVVANAGIYEPVDARAFDAETVARVFSVNVMGTANLIAAALPDMVRRRQGHLHIVSSATGFGGMPTASAYGASKAALINMAQCLKIELDRCGVGVSLSTPGFVDTPAQTDNAFPKPFMITPAEAAARIADSVESGAFSASFPRRFTWALKALYALPSPVWLPLVRRQTGWSVGKEPPAPKKSAR